MSQSSRILVALSGGVDSAVAALLLKQQGYDVSAAYMRTWMNEEGSDILADCPWEEDIRQAKAVAAHLGIDFEVVNLIQDYRERVVQYLVDGYRQGITPNPDIMCNREMKFGVFRDYARRNGFSAVATGHYCRRVENPDGSCDLLAGLDPNKDQSYFLALVRQEQLRDALFPIGELLKPRVRKIALENQLPNAARKDSQGICFLGKVNINDFLRYYIPDRPGKIVRAGTGEILGEHRGLHHFTLGQRQGIGVPSNTDNEHFVVVSKDFDTNHLVIAFDHHDSPGLWGQSFTLERLSWVNQPVDEQRTLQARARYRDPPVEINFQPVENGRAKINFCDPQRALAVGQVCALYDGSTLLGGGFYS
ncbi:tRNA 2-thiouridine(34) synthase MnmA [Cerasicoccus arenae]|uniref:tRNA-specific 2-thiouridylase MnmA n=1 Tax=Cerasicoccus arenae TaxID=424488 RepID=A0A8J3D6D7_9BACT|nr:tRNA 2-thiouridine(34) synthase MnmA [Cerasicoccus arenae]MBK1856879.1 tRNA 2-thiouridine(34) synthase MnmA [Cerasicoccus arenae]GHB89626.1 tRNA-specific 2-thiouridylase MnmA [Cerasicoccus arenae]